ncbi:hypothetical protein R70723_30175 [Paenibacillus sp. FSL R7-0273]|uniref:type II secretion system protein n=1 Tax=Paenibacillus sp. FSL R7-0273 TaxID=1536772 RepID=UPI0004F7E4BB|nr:prepilin-type N-terminal cleavage/methylation domain-containing protein [Paenibacillus sp. FSL R7-0273]AIQ49671.1 hypothetical protein R70723_30175 [Paenibacillus sp. FSL R7-0273]OMF90268.1 hypothetical protein BK144_17885 [Paenibacillus sp. FSL R7-0273]
MLAQAIRKKLGKAGKEEKGFTLIELLAVIVILGIIAVIAVPLIGNVIQNSREDGDIATARQIYDAARLYIVGEENGNFEGAGTVDIIAEIQADGYLDTPLSLPSSKAVITAGTVTFDADGNLSGMSITPAPQGSTPVASSTAGTYTPAQILSVDIDK